MPRLPGGLFLGLVGQNFPRNVLDLKGGLRRLRGNLSSAVLSVRLTFFLSHTQNTSTYLIIHYFIKLGKFSAQGECVLKSVLCTLSVRLKNFFTHSIEKTSKTKTFQKSVWPLTNESNSNQ
jgi:hypothetical protein